MTVPSWGFEPGSLVINPTDLSLDYPYGGTELGNTAGISFHPNKFYAKIVAEELLGYNSRISSTGENPVLGCVLREWNNNAIQTLFPSATDGSASGTFIIDGGYIDSNLSQEVSGVSLLFVPENKTSYFIYLPQAKPLPDPALAISLRADKELGIGCVFVGLIDQETNRSYRIGKKADIESFFF